MVDRLGLTCFPWRSPRRMSGIYVGQMAAARDPHPSFVNRFANPSLDSPTTVASLEMGLDHTNA